MQFCEIVYFAFSARVHQACVLMCEPAANHFKNENECLLEQTVHSCSMRKKLPSNGSCKTHLSLLLTISMHP